MERRTRLGIGRKWKNVFLSLLVSTFGIYDVLGRLEKKTERMITMEIKIKYHTDIEPLAYIGGNKSNWIDMRSAET